MIVICRHLDDVHVPNERSMAQLHVQMEIISQLETQVRLCICAVNDLHDFYSWGRLWSQPKSVTYNGI